MIKTSELIWQDTQHQELFRLIDLIKADHFDNSVLDLLDAYTENHFRLEEAYMAALDFPDTESHVRSHDRFREELRQMRAMQEDMDAALRQSLSLFLESWLKRHVFGRDKDFEAFVMASDRK